MEQQMGAAAYGSSSQHVANINANSTFEDLDSAGRSRVVILQPSARNLLVQNSQQLVIAALSTLLVTLIVLHFHHIIQRRRNLPPGPWPWPILGNLPDMGMASKELPHRYFCALADKFGGLMYLQLGSQPCIVVSTVAVAKELFQKNDVVFASRPTRLYWTTNTGNTDYKNFSGAPHGPYWRQLRRLCNTELFSPQRHASYARARTEEVHHMMKDLLIGYARKGNTMNLKDKMFGVVANNMTRMLTNKRYFGDGAQDQHEREDLQLLLTNVFVAFSSFVISDYIPSLSFISKVQGVYRKFEELGNLTKALAGRVFELEKHRERAKGRLLQDDTDKDYVPDFVDVLLAAPLEDGKPLPKHDITTILVDMLLAGTETTSNTVEWAMAELMSHPDVMQRAQDELVTVVGDHRLVQESDIPNLPYLQAIVKEVFRLHAPVPLALPHQSTQASNVLGFHLPEHTHLILNIFAIHRDPSVYENPETFNPQRFVDHHPEASQTSGFDSYELIPFGAGRRMCPAYNLGNLMVSLLLAHLLHGFDWSLPKGHNRESLDMAEFFGITVSMKTPLCLVARPRNPANLYNQ